MSTISVDFDVLNQRGSPAWFTDTFANIPTAGFVGRMFISKDTFAFYRDTGSGWDLIGGPGIGTLTGSGVTGQVSFFNGTQVLTGSNNLFWDNTNSRLGINTTTPGVALDIHSTANSLIQLNNTTTANSVIAFQNQSVTKWRIGNEYGSGANIFSIFNFTTTSTPFQISNTTNQITINGAVDTGSNNITAQHYVANGNTGIAGTILLNQNTSPAVAAGKTGVYSTGNDLTIMSDFASGKTAIFSLTGLTSARSYTLPNATGTFALISDLTTGYVPYTGATSNLNLGIYGLLAAAIVIGQTSTQGYIHFKTGGPTLLSANTSQAPFGISGMIYSFDQTSSNYKQFVLDSSLLTNNTIRTYSMPDATGTLALTSNLSSYLPLTGGTLTGQLFINPANTAITGLDVASNNTSIRSDTINGFPRQLLITMGSGTLIQLTAQGYGANYGTDLAFYTATTGGVNASPGIYITGTNNRVGIKTGLPSYDLDISGDLRSTTTSYLATTSGNIGIGSTTIYNGGGFGKVISFYDATSLALTYVTNTQQYQVGIAGNDYRVYDFTGSTYRFAIKGSTGNVIIDGTTDNGAKLQVNGTSAFYGEMNINNGMTMNAQSLGNVTTAWVSTNLSTLYVGFVFVYWANSSSGERNTAVITCNYYPNGITTISQSNNGGNGVQFQMSGSTLQIRTTSGTAAGVQLVYWKV